MKALREIARIKTLEVQLNDKMKALEKYKSCFTGMDDIVVQMPG